MTNVHLLPEGRLNSCNCILKKTFTGQDYNEAAFLTNTDMHNAWKVYFQLRAMNRLSQPFLRMNESLLSGHLKDFLHNYMDWLSYNSHDNHMMRIQSQ